MELMRVLAVDLGAKRIGTAISDALGISARPLETFRRSSPERDIAKLKALAEQLGAEAIVVGLPLRMDGSLGEAAAAALQFARALQDELGLPVFTQDERLTSYEAEQLMIERSLDRDERREMSDAVAAAIILRDFLSKMGR